eukprot:TRINITY_DN24910_c0_g1_i1.p1 TRINITY_DN24910_c0_g1~~TRINITY_DN24910_c0_g1_i1.p1  ORF type:complete len:839 (+),score=163.53 TRINITY_DN24910_c0_g1_i1:48-2564(+)
MALLCGFALLACAAVPEAGGWENRARAAFDDMARRTAFLYGAVAPTLLTAETVPCSAAAHGAMMARGVRLSSKDSPPEDLLPSDIHTTDADIVEEVDEILNQTCDAAPSARCALGDMHWVAEEPAAAVQLNNPSKRIGGLAIAAEDAPTSPTAHHHVDVDVDVQGEKLADVPEIVASDATTGVAIRDPVVSSAASAADDTVKASARGEDVFTKPTVIKDSSDKPQTQTSPVGSEPETSVPRAECEAAPHTVLPEAVRDAQPRTVGSSDLAQVWLALGVVGLAVLVAFAWTVAAARGDASVLAAECALLRKELGAQASEVAVLKGREAAWEAALLEHGTALAAVRTADYTTTAAFDEHVAKAASLEAQYSALHQETKALAAAVMAGDAASRDAAQQIDDRVSKLSSALEDGLTRSAHRAQQYCDGVKAEVLAAQEDAVGAATTCVLEKLTRSTAAVKEQVYAELEGHAAALSEKLNTYKAKWSATLEQHTAAVKHDAQESVDSQLVTHRAAMGTEVKMELAKSRRGVMDVLAQHTTAADVNLQARLEGQKAMVSAEIVQLREEVAILAAAVETYSTSLSPGRTIASASPVESSTSRSPPHLINALERRMIMIADVDPAVAPSPTGAKQLPPDPSPATSAASAQESPHPHMADPTLNASPRAPRVLAAPSSPRGFMPPDSEQGAASQPTPTPEHIVVPDPPVLEPEVLASPVFHPVHVAPVDAGSTSGSSSVGSAPASPMLNEEMLEARGSNVSAYVCAKQKERIGSYISSELTWEKQDHIFGLEDELCDLIDLAESLRTDNPASPGSPSSTTHVASAHASPDTCDAAAASPLADVPSLA